MLSGTNVHGGYTLCVCVCTGKGRYADGGGGLRWVGGSLDASTDDCVGYCCSRPAFQPFAMCAMVRIAPSGEYTLVYKYPWRSSGHNGGPSGGRASPAGTAGRTLPDDLVAEDFMVRTYTYTYTHADISARVGRAHRTSVCV